MRGRWCDGPPFRLPRHYGERQASQGRALLVLAARLLLGLGLLGSGSGGSVVLGVLLARHVVLAWLCGKLFAGEALAFIGSDVGSKGGDEVGETAPEFLSSPAEWFLQEQNEAKNRPENRENTKRTEPVK